MSKKIGKTNAFEELMDIRAGKDLSNDEVEITGEDPLFPTPFRIGETIADALAARAVSANDLWEIKTGNRQSISVDARAAAATCLGGEDMTQKRNEDGEYQPIPVSEDVEHMVELTQPWKTKDNRWFVPHFNLPHLEKKVLEVLECEATPDSVAKAVSKWNADELDNAIAEVGACGGVVRSPEEWLKHPQGGYLASRPVVEITKISDSEPEPLPEGPEPLSGIRVLDLTRILAGPTAGIGMAEHGADVQMITAPHLPQVSSFVRDTSHGKRSSFLDFNKTEEKLKLKEMAHGADVFIEGYRPNRLAAHGFSAEDFAKSRPGIIYVSINCYGSGGPFSSRAGWDQVAQAVTGICEIQGKAMNENQPKLTPVYLCDFLTGFLGTFGAMTALARRAREGGSYKVEVSLCQSAMLIQRQGLLDKFNDATGQLSAEEFNEYAVYDNNTAYGDLKSLGPVIKMSETPPKWSLTTPKLGSSKAQWVPR